MSDEIGRLRAHVEKHKHHQQAFFSTAGLAVLLDDLKDKTVKLNVANDVIEKLKAQVERLLAYERTHIENLEQLRVRNEALEAQVKRLIAKEGKRISDVLGDQRKGVELRREQGGD